MSEVKEQNVIPALAGDVYVQFCCDRKEGYGVEILHEQGCGGDLVEAARFSFGHDVTSHDLARQWFAGVTNLIEQNGGNVPGEICDITCFYDDKYPEMSLLEVDKIRAIIEREASKVQVAVSH